MATAPTATKVAPQTRQTAPAGRAAPTHAPTPALRPQNAVALPAGLAAELAQHAKDAAAKERPSVGRISLKSGVMQFAGNAVPGNNMDVIIVGVGHRNVFYSGRYDPNNIVNPDCFALSESGDDMEPHENVTAPVHESCAGCPNGEWGSDPNGGRGKACKETRRLILLPANILEQEGDLDEIVKKSEMAILDVPVTSVKNYANFVNTLAATINLPMWCVVTNVAVVPDARTQFKVTFTPLHVAGDEAVIRAIMTRRDEALRIALVPYEGTGGEADPDAGKAPAPAAPVPKGKFAAKAAPARR